jgi:hypothetical protein
MVDEAALPPSKLDDVPRGAFMGAGSSQLPSPQVGTVDEPAHVVWNRENSQAAGATTATPCGGGTVSTFSAVQPHVLEGGKAGWPVQAFLAPIVWLGSTANGSASSVGIELLGESDKITAVKLLPNSLGRARLAGAACERARSGRRGGTLGVCERCGGRAADMPHARREGGQFGAHRHGAERNCEDITLNMHHYFYAGNIQPERLL